MTWLTKETYLCVGDEQMPSDRVVYCLFGISLFEWYVYFVSLFASIDVILIISRIIW